MKKQTKVVIAIILGFIILLSGTSCKSEKVNSPGATTTSDQDRLESALVYDGISDADISNKFFVYENGHYLKNVSNSPVVYWGYTELMNPADMATIINYMSDYFHNPDVDIPVKPAFTKKMDRNFFTNEQYNSISDINLSILNCNITGNHAGRIHYCFDCDQIKTFQIELPKKENFSVHKWEWILLHELGHGFGLNDVKDSSLKKETVMYYSVEGFISDNPPAFYTIDVYALNLLYGN